MARSTTVIRKRRQSQRVLDREETEAFSVHESPLPEEGDAPFRNLRSRQSTCPDDASRSSSTSSKAKFISSKAALKESTNVNVRSSTSTRKRSSRATSLTIASRSSDPSPKKRKQDLKQPPTDSLGTTSCQSTAITSTTNKVTVTPSPAANPASPAFSFQSPSSVPPRKPKNLALENVSALPSGVLDLYPTSRSSSFCRNPQCQCTTNNPRKTLTSIYIHSYGKEHWQYIKDHETAVVPEALVSGSPHSSRSRSTRSHASSVSSTPRSIKQFHLDPEAVYESPDHRRYYTKIDPSYVGLVAEPNESTKFLKYQPELTPKMRAILMDWIIELSDHFSFGPDTLHLAITLIDRVLATGPECLDDEGDDDIHHDVGSSESQTNCFHISRDRFQLLGATCTWLACKLEESKAPAVQQISYVSDHIYSVEQIKRMERRVCRALNFSLVSITPHSFLLEFMRASAECSFPGCEPAATFQHMVNYLLELGRLPYAPVTQKPSLLAASAVYLARVTLGIAGGPWTETLQYYTGYQEEDLKATVMALHSYQLASESSSLKAAYAKYRTKKYNRVALKTVPLPSALGF
eukprot:Nitzschia sp. Nitz4//scaffold264_size26629//14396//16211//NITZ4_008235-RA/size26629-augustus-gene-0.9-mRNA-1//-1//CDS//3329544800//991//frame0